VATDTELLTAVEEALLGRLSKQYESLSFGGQSVRLMSPDELLKVRDTLKARVDALTSPMRTHVRFRDD